MRLPFPILIGILCGVISGILFPLGSAYGEKRANEQWQRRTREAGFSIVTRYDVLTGEAKQVLIRLPVVEIKP